MNLFAIATQLLPSVLGQTSRQLSSDDKLQIQLNRDWEEGRMDRSTYFARAFQTPILFYGRVVDQDLAPVEGARVVYSPSIDFAVALAGRNPRLEIKSDKDGFFEIRSQGSDIYVSVGKEGYRQVRVNHPQTVNPGDSVGSGVKIQYFDFTGRPEFNHRPVAKLPVQFALRKVGKLASLHIVDKLLSPRPNGDPLRISLDGSEGAGHRVQIICKSDFNRGAVKPGVLHQYSWSFEVLVEGGGIQELKDEGFVAPESGYLPKMMVASVDATSERWFGEFPEKTYYVRFDDGVSAKFNCQGGTSYDDKTNDPYVYFKSWLNPDSKSRSLETSPLPDPGK